MRYVLIDRVVAAGRGRFLEAVKVFPLTDECCHSRFEFGPTVPESLLVESMAQAGGILLSSENPEEPGGLVLAKIETARFRAPVLAGQLLELRAEVLEPGAEAVRMQTTVRHGGAVVAEMTYFLARRDLGEGADRNVDDQAFMRAHRERGIVLGVADLLREDS